jgi:hypothetical protein
MNFYELSQNNSGGKFTVNEQLCHRLIIETEDERKAIHKAEELGCYWDGVEDGRDCSCCGDRWYKSADEINLQKYKEKGYPAYEYFHKGNMKSVVEATWFQKYGNLPRLEEPKWEKMSYGEKFTANIYFKNIEQYAQFMANQYGHTTPDIRIFYADGTVKEIFRTIK